MELDVHPARPEEYEEAGRVTALAYREFVPDDERRQDWLDYLEEIADVRGRADRSLVLVAVEDGRVLGTATIEFPGRPLHEHEADPGLEPGSVRLRMLGVDPDARSRGVAQALLEASLEESRRSGSTRMVLNTTERMRAAQRLYERNGFVREPDHQASETSTWWSYSRLL